ncbi:MAG: acylneuraminate cytidylyltransferase family protein [Myxococcota bacterium]|nr:acylneuraminate cytidylyltransferase family protein [Myxococcota bacterium]
MSVLALVPARGGSRGIPHKNITPLAGKPLLHWTIEAALACGRIERVVVSTDDPEIADAARDCGADVPFLRPSELARDRTPGIDPVLHAVGWLANEEGYRPEWVALLQPTSPLPTTDDVRGALALAVDWGAAAVTSITEAEHHPWWMKRIDPDGRVLSWSEPPQRADRRQDLPPAFALNGAIYLTRREALQAERSLSPEPTYGYVMPPERSLDIDTPWDLHLAELILREREAHAAA